MKKKRIELPSGAVELLLLKSLGRKANHGYGLIQSIRERSEEALCLEEGSLYPALHRMERHGWIESEWGQSENGRRAKFYALTDEGRKHLKGATKTWTRMTGAMGLVLGLRPAGA
jgi:PadR family transcriptional regulator, regulatory protein PadR